jgi:hypothetical protein
MSDSNERPEAEGAPQNIRSDGDHVAKPETPNGNPTADPSKEGPTPMDDPTAALKRELANHRLPADVKAQILAELPPSEERERLLRELIENGGLSFEECFGPLWAEFEGLP